MNAMPPIRPASKRRKKTMEIISNVALISINETLIVQLISFLIFVFILNRVMIRPLRGTMDARESHIEELKAEMDAAGKTIEQLTKQIRKEERTAINSAHSVREQIENTGRHEAERIISAARSQVEEQVDANRAKIKAQIDAAQQSIRVEAEGLSVRVMEKLLDRRLSL
jgi:F-type H+-transporting ATPase subunit b